MNKPNRKFSPKPTGEERSERPRRPRTNEGSRAAGFSDKRYSPILDPDDNKEWKQREEAGRRYRPASGERTESRRTDGPRGDNSARPRRNFNDEGEGGKKFRTGERSGFRKDSESTGGYNRRPGQGPREDGRRNGPRAEGQRSYGNKPRAGFGEQDSDGTGRPYRAPREDGRQDSRYEGNSSGRPRTGGPRSGETRSGETRSGETRSGETRSEGYGNRRTSSNREDSFRGDGRRSDSRAEDSRTARGNSGRRGESRFENPKSSAARRTDVPRGEGPRRESRSNKSENTRSDAEGRTPFKKKDLTERKSVSTSTPPTYDFSKIRSKAPKTDHTEANIRLNKYIADAGICSRRDADELIASGQVKVNGEVITQMGHKVSRNDTVTYNGRKINPEKLVYVLLNKPKDFITTTEDPQERKTVMQLVDDAAEQRIYPVGRLDRNTTGLLLLTNDGELAEKLSHPSYQIKKVYQALLDKPLTEEDFEKIQQGLVLEDGPAPVNELGYVTPDKTVIGLEIHIGRNRIVRRIFESLGYDVIGLDRVIYAGLTKKDLPRGNWRYLTEKEVIRLKHFN